jgi:hypothetical protein
MEAFTSRIEVIINHLDKGVRFGLYDGGNSCYFEDGKKVNYHELWTAIRILNKLEAGHRRTLYNLYPDLFMGTFPYKFSKYRLTRKVIVELFGWGKSRYYHGYLPKVSIP